MPFPPVDPALDLVALERRVLERWRAGRVFEASLARRRGAPEWVFYEGPPTANGRPGLHHVWARSFKDLFPRFQTMRGRHVARKGGWDCHGLPVEVEVEKELGLSGKAQIREFGVEAFNARCRASVRRYVEEWARLTERIGMWLDTDDAYWTLTDSFIESVWWLFRQMWDQGLIYEGFKVVPYCGRCGTALSSHEVAQGYRDVTEDSVYVRFPVDGRDFDLLAWTTTPWTLISNVAAAVGPGIDYVRVRPEASGADGRPGGARDVVLARSRVSAVMGDDAEIVGEVPVSELVGLTYERPFAFLAVPATTDGRPAPRVVAADFVTTGDGSGIVHLAPAFGEVDREVGVAENLPLLNPVDAAARFDATVAPWAGLFVKDADAGIVAALAGDGRLERTEPYTHSYPHCWRCGTPLVYYARTSWFARTASRRDALMAENDGIGWHPSHIRHGRFGDWLEHNVDWALSRDRYWGTPLPVWRCGGLSGGSGVSPGVGGHDTCVGSVAELSELSGRDLAGLDLHRPYVDDVTFPCPTAGCGATARRVEPVLDAWFDSGSMPSAQFHHPFAGVDLDARFPADFICEAIDQTRGWFYSLLAVNTLVFGRSPYRNVVCLAHVVDADGQKMSKSKGNAMDPWEVLDRHGADALRWYFFSAGSPWTNRRVFTEAIDEAARKFLLTLWNTLSFFVTYANLGDFTPGRDEGEDPPGTGHVLDRWIRSRREATVLRVTGALDGFDTLAAAGALESFVDDLSNWYVRRCRPRFWKAADRSAFVTLQRCLVTASTLLAPFCPFIADEIHAVLAGVADGADVDSVHLADWPEPVTAHIDPSLDAEVALARRLTALGRAARAESLLKVRQPLRRALLLVPPGPAPGGDGVAVPLSAEMAVQVAEELNVKAIEVVPSLAGLVRYSVVPNFRLLGPRLGPRMPALRAALADLDGAAVLAALEADGRVGVEVAGETVVLTAGEVEVRVTGHEEFALAQDGPFAAALDLTLDDDLRSEGLARELARALNDLRKASGFAIADRVGVRLFAEGPPGAAAERHGPWIAGEVLAVRFEVNPEGAVPTGCARPLEVSGSPVRVEMEVVRAGGGA